MTTSGVTVFNPTRDQVIYGALRMCGGYSIFDTPKTAQVTFAAESLNMMLKSWQQMGFLWLREWVTLFVTESQTKYLLPGAKVAKTVLTAELGAALAAAGTVVTLDDTTGMTALDVVGILQDDGTLFWDTIHSVDSSTQITMHNGVTSAAASGNAVYTYTTAYGRPTRVYGATVKNSSDVETELNILSRQDYFMRPSKTTTGTPVEFYYDPQLITGALHLWPAPDDESVRIMLHVDRVIEDMTSSGETFDVPQHVAECVKYGLAVRLAPEYGLPSGERQLLVAEFNSLMENMTNYDRDPAPTFFQPEI